MASNRGLVDLVSSDYGAGWINDQLRDLISGPVRHLVARAQRAGVVRPDVDATDIAVILALLSSVPDRPLVAGVPEPTRRYLALILAGAAPGRHAAARPSADRRGNAVGSRGQGVRRRPFGRLRT